ncbi:MAG: hypothetical protein HY698_10020 [Deltaproteobacteria bacterium]|nr:hypothetical protein [Deltaproteobacteria bacterium]
MISVAGAPLEQEIAAMASGLAPHQLSVHAGVLRSEHLARTAGPHGRDTIFTYHDRVRNAVLLHLEPTKRRACHHELARTLESTERGDPEVLAVHYRAAGDQEKAAKYAVVAADRATGALAFEQAARLYQLAIKLGRYPRSEERPLLVKLGQALMNAGRGKEAAEAYLAAADGASVGEALQLQQKAALQLLITGHVDEGIAAIRTVLAAEGLSYPATPRKALMSLLVDRARLRIRGLRFRRRDESEITAHQLARIDACWSAGIGLALCDPVRGTAFQGKGLLLALDAGEARRVSRALAMEAAFLASQGVRNQARAELYLSRAEEVAREVDDPYSVALACGLRAFACYFWGQWTLALEYCEKSEQLFQERCVGVHWEIANARIWIARLLYFSGRMRELSQRAPIYLLACRDRGNLHGETTFRAGVAPFLALAADDPGSGHEEARWAVENWSRQGFHLQHHYALYSRAQLYAYQGNPEKALEILTDEWPALKRSLLLRVQHVRVTMYEVRARAFLGAACANSPAKKHLIAQAEKDARSLHRENAPWATALATLVQAGIATSLGNQERAAEFFADAERGLEAVHMSLHAACARWQRGLLLGGDDGRALVDSATLWMLGEAIKNPERMTALLAPGVS